MASLQLIYIAGMLARSLGLA